MRFAPVQDTRFGRSIEAAGRYNANGYKLTGAVRQFCIIDTLVVIHTTGIFVIILAAGGLPPVRCKSEFVGAIVAAARTAVHLLLDKGLDLFFVQDFPGFRQVLHGSADRCRDGRCMGISGGVVLLNFGLDQLHQRLHLRVNGDGQVGFCRNGQQNGDFKRKLGVCACGRDFNAALVLHQEQECFGAVIQDTENADLVHNVGVCCTGDLNADLTGGFAVVCDGFDAQQGQLVRVAADCGFCRQVGVNRAGAAHGAGDGQCAAGERFRQQGGTGFRVTGFFPTHVVCPPIVMVTVSCVCASLPAA